MITLLEAKISEKMVFDEEDVAIILNNYINSEPSWLQNLHTETDYYPEVTVGEHLSEYLFNGGTIEIQLREELERDHMLGMYELTLKDLEHGLEQWVNWRIKDTGLDKIKEFRNYDGDHIVQLSIFENICY